MHVSEAPITLVAIDEEPTTLGLVQDVLAREDLEVIVSTDAEKGLDLILQTRPQIVLLDLVMPRAGGMELLRRITSDLPETAVILLTSHYSTECAVEAVQKGARDYINKPVLPAKLKERIDQVIEEVRCRWRVTELEQELIEVTSFQNIIGRGPKMREVFAQIRRIAPHFRTVLVSGETGTGKELVAKALHELSPRASGPFVACNCSAIVETLIDSELFGYVKGAFTGARKDKIGFLEYANGGTLLLDEIGDMPLTTQSRLLRVLQNQEVQRVGSPATHKIDIRVIAATHRNIKAMVASNQFRHDLYYRLSMLKIQLPRLSDRIGDLPLLQRYYLDRFSEEYKKPIVSLTARAQALLAGYPWPGNVRELENVLGHACMMAAGEIIDVNDFPEDFLEQAKDPTPREETVVPLEEFERSYVRRVLRLFAGNKLRAAEALGISRSRLYSILTEEQADASHE